MRDMQMKASEAMTPLAFLNPDKAWVTKELDLLLAEWKAWQRDVDQIVDHPYDEAEQSEVFADGEFLQRTPVRIDVLPRELEVVAPPA